LRWRGTLAHGLGAALGALGKGREGLIAQAVVVLDQVNSARGEAPGQQRQLVGRQTHGLDCSRKQRSTGHAQ
jgi:hypothetical protein